MLSRWRKEYREGKFVSDKHKNVTVAVNKVQKELAKVKRLQVKPSPGKRAASD